MSWEPAERPQRKAADPRWAGVGLIALGLCASLLGGLCASTFGELSWFDQFLGALRMFGLLILVGIFLILRKWD